jgi:hypothetical protein
MAFVTSSKTQKEILLSYLRGTSRVLSASQALSMFGVKNLSARMSELRRSGYTVRLSKNKSGKTTYSIFDQADVKK